MYKKISVAKRFTLLRFNFFILKKEKYTTCEVARPCLRLLRFIYLF